MIPIKADLVYTAYSEAMAAVSVVSPTLFPKEHGAYVQLGLALASGLALGHGTRLAWGQTLLTTLVFLASEPALILLGYRQSERHPSRKLCTSGLLILFGALALWLVHAIWWQPSPVPWRILLLPAFLASILMALALARREHTTLGELMAAWALASAAYPVAVLGSAGTRGAGTREAALLALTLAGSYSIGTATVRAFLGSLKHTGRPWSRIVPLCLGAFLVGLAGVSGLPWAVALAMVPSTGIAAWIFLAPPSPRHLKRIGWILSLGSMTGVLPLILALR